MFELVAQGAHPGVFLLHLGRGQLAGPAEADDRGHVLGTAAPAAFLVAALLHKHQIEVRKALPDQAKRRFFMREVLNGPIAQLAMDGDMDAAGEQLVEALAQGGKVRGRVRYIAGRGPADLLTLRAARTLAAADILIADEDADPQILSLARRDAERIDPAEIDVKGLIAHADTGLQVARVITGPVDAADLRALMKAKVEVEVLLAAPSA